MDVIPAGSRTVSPLIQGFSESGRSDQPTSSSQERTAALSSEQGKRELLSSDRVEIRGNQLLYYASQEIDFQETGLRVLANGNYSYRQISLEARQDILIGLDLGTEGAAGVDLEEVTGQLRQIVEDLQQGFRESLQQMLQSLRSQRVQSAPLSSIQNQPGGLSSSSNNLLSGLNLSDTDKALLNDYLVLIRQLAGDDSEAGRLVRQLQKMLGLGEQVQQATAQTETTASRVQVDFSFTEIEIQIQGSQQQGQVQEGEPLVLDLNGNGFELRSMENGVLFDIDNDGLPEKTGFVTGGDALLALDKNGDGLINGVAELFGDRTGARNGFEDLARYDSNRDGRIDSQDPVFDRLLLFRDTNGDGRSQPGELLTLESQGIVSISTRPRPHLMTVAGNRITETAEFIRTDGTKGLVGEAYFRYKD